MLMAQGSQLASSEPLNFPEAFDRSDSSNWLGMEMTTHYGLL